jgi:Fe2+ or Zn2+ uptake regulation protein
MNARAVLQDAQVTATGWRKRVLMLLSDSAEAYTPVGLLRRMLAEGDPINPPTLYRVLKDLEKAGLLTCQQRGRHRIYRCRAKAVSSPRVGTYSGL